MAQHNPAKHYGLNKVRRSLLHFASGRAMAGLLNLAALILVIKVLSVPEFALYSSLHALVLVLALITSLGVGTTLLRMIPELRAQDKNSQMYRLMLAGMALRSALFAGGAGLCLLFVASIGQVLTVPGVEEFLALYLLVGLTRTAVVLLAGMMESLLWQKQVQYTLAIGAGVKFFGLLWLMFAGAVSLRQLIYLELIVEALMFAGLALSGIGCWVSDRQIEDDNSTNAIPWLRYIKFSGLAYLQNLTSVLSGSGANRLFVAALFQTELVALYGVIDRLMEYIRRYEPTRLLLGMIRPVLNAHFQGRNSFTDMASIADALIRGNIVLLFVPLIALVFWLEPLMLGLGRAEYAVSWQLFAAFFFIAIITTLHTLLDLLVKLVERAQIYAVANVLLSGSLLLAIGLAPTFGLWAIVIANIIGQTLAIGVVIVGLWRAEYKVLVNWRRMIMTVVLGFVAIGVGLVLKSNGLHTLWAGLVGVIVYLVMMFASRPIDRKDIGQITSVLRRGDKQSELVPVR